MTDALILILAILTFILGFAWAVDSTVKDPLKEKFVGYLNQDSDDNSYNMAIRSFEAILGHKLASLRFFYRSLLLSLAFISTLCLYKLWDPWYFFPLKSALFSPSSALSCILIMLIGTLISDWICFGKSLLFVQLFSTQRKFFAVIMLATADLCLTILTYAIIVGFTAAVSVIVFDATNKKILNFLFPFFPTLEITYQITPQQTTVNNKVIRSKNLLF